MSQETPVQPRLSDLLARYLEKQTEAHAAGITSDDREVTPYEVGPVQPLDAKLAWDEAQTALGSAQLLHQKAPPHWSAIVAHHESVVAIAFCAGNFPQLVRDFHTILTEPNLQRLRPEAGRPAAVDLNEWTQRVSQQGHLPQMVLALGVLRLARHFDAAEAFVRRHDARVPAEWRTAWDNEKAALAWHQGRCDEARALWNTLEPTVAVRFNRGMAALFAGAAAEAKPHLSAAIALLPETSAWHHLARLYLTMAQLH